MSETPFPAYLDKLNQDIDRRAEIPTLRPEDVQELVPGQDIHGPLESEGVETLRPATIGERAPTVRTDATMELEASKAQTFKTAETMEHEEAEVETLRRLEQGYMEYGQIHGRVTKWLEDLEQMLKQPQALPELAGLYAEAKQIKDQVEGRLDLEEYAKAKSESGAVPFTIEVPVRWFALEARLNEIKEALRAPTIREVEVPTMNLPQGPKAVAA